MNQTDVVNRLKSYISTEILDGQDIGLDGSTPLIEWGILNSMEITRIVAFIHERFDVELPGDKMTIEHFKNLDSLADLVLNETAD